MGIHLHFLHTPECFSLISYEACEFNKEYTFLVHCTLSVKSIPAR